MNYQLLALDLDGTVMTSNLLISQPVRQAVAAAQARGVRVTIATGRMFGAARPFAVQLGIADPLICYQGAVVRHPHSGEVYLDVRMPADLAAEAVRLLDERGLFVVAYIDERLYVARRRAELDLYLRWHPEEPEVVVVPQLADALETLRPTKLLFVAEPPLVERELARLSAHFGVRLVTVRSHELFGELTSPGVSKGVALAALANQLGIPRDQVMAIGDHENDLEMITWAGLGLAMGNAIPAVRAAAAAVIPSVEEDGVAWAIERYLLG